MEMQRRVAVPQPRSHQRQDKNSMPPWRFPINSAMRGASDLGHCLLRLSRLPSARTESQRSAKHRHLEKDDAAERQGPGRHSRYSEGCASSQASLLCRFTRFRSILPIHYAIGQTGISDDSEGQQGEGMDLLAHLLPRGQDRPRSYFDWQMTSAQPPL